MILPFIVPTVCKLPPQTFALIVMGAFAMVFALFSAIVTFIDGITFIWIRWNAKQLTIQERHRKLKYEDGRGELCIYVMPWISLVQNFCNSDIMDESG